MPVYGPLPFCKQKSPLVFRYDCKRISDLLMNFIVLAIMVIRAFTPNRYRVLKGTADIPGFANAGSTCLPSAVVALQIVVEHFLSQNTTSLQSCLPPFSPEPIPLCLPAGNRFHCATAPTQSWRFCSPRPQRQRFYAA
jgi:hypothetical protein